MLSAPFKPDDFPLARAAAAIITTIPCLSHHRFSSLLLATGRPWPKDLPDAGVASAMRMA
jgi:hypothetical protein